MQQDERGPPESDFIHGFPRVLSERYDKAHITRSTNSVIWLLTQEGRFPSVSDAVKREKHHL